MSDVTEKMLDQKLFDREQMTTVELTDKELESVYGAWDGGFFPSTNNSTAFAVTSVAFSNNQNSCFW